MALIEILEVITYPMDADELVGNLDLPVSGTPIDVYHVTLAGWALSRGSRVAAIEVFDQHQMIRTMPINVPRPDVAEAYRTPPDQLISGFYEFVGLIGSPLQFELSLYVVLEDQRRLPFATIRGRRQPLRSTFEPTLQPLLITSLGRSGSTWLMRLLAEHPRIVALRQYPYESSMAQYWLHMLRVVSRPADFARSEQPGLRGATPFFVGHNPYFQRELHHHPAPHNWVGHEYVEELTAFCLRSVEGWYRHVSQGQDQPNAQYFAEKRSLARGWPLILELYPDPREIFLVRDFRDVACSMRAFAAKRGNPYFGQHQIEPNEAFVQSLRDEARSLLEIWKSREDRSHLVRYEDLILHPVDTTASILDYLGLEASPAVIEGMLGRSSADTPETRWHRTSASLSSSVGRWRQDFDAPMQDLCQLAFAEVLHEFGYR